MPEPDDLDAEAFARLERIARAVERSARLQEMQMRVTFRMLSAQHSALVKSGESDQATRLWGLMREVSDLLGEAEPITLPQPSPVVP